jgi:hypothetical protein
VSSAPQNPLTTTLSLKQAVVQAIAASSRHTLFDSKTGVVAVKQSDGSVQVRFGRYQHLTNAKKHVRQDVLHVTFTGSGIRTKTIAHSAKQKKNTDIEQNVRLCKAVSHAYEHYVKTTTTPSHTSFDIEAKEYINDQRGYGDQGNTRYRYYIRLLPYEPGQSYGFYLSKEYKVVGINPGT